MDMAAKFTGFVIAAYAVAFVALGALILGVMLRMRGVRRRLGELEAAGALRRRPVAPTRGAPTSGAPNESAEAS